MNMKKKRILLVSVAAVATTMGAMAQGEYVCGDFHQHRLTQTAHGLSAP